MDTTTVVLLASGTLVVAVAVVIVFRPFSGIGPGDRVHERGADRHVSEAVPPGEAGSHAGGD